MRFKRLAAAVLAAVMLIGVLPSTAFAAGCADGAHDLSGALQAPNYAECIGGSKVPFRVCQSCWLPFDENGNSPEWYEGTGVHTPEYVRDADYASCTGGYIEAVYQCTGCGSFCSATGGELQYVAGTGAHQFGKLNAPNYTVCGGGFVEPYYNCELCNSPWLEDGVSRAYWIDGTGQHQLGELQETNFTECRGGFKVAYRDCLSCGQPFDEDGNSSVWYEGNGQHQLGVLQAPDYTECGGGFKESYYRCELCNDPLLADGVTQPEWVEGTGAHTPGEYFEGDWTECGGGFVVPFYDCGRCGRPFDENGNSPVWYDGTGQHQLGEVNAPNFIECRGGFKEPFYDCVLCGQPFDENGNSAEWYAGNGRHQLGGLQAPNYTECGGGFKVSFYPCVLCEQPWLADGVTRPEWVEGTGAHSLVLWSEADYTSCDGGYTEDVYLCTVCGNEYDANGDDLQYLEGAGAHSLVFWREADYTPCGGGFTEDVYYCTACGNLYTADGSYGEWYEGLGHDLVLGEAKQSTCTRVGWGTYQACTRCDYSTRAWEVWTWGGHNYMASVVPTEPTCTGDGYAVYTCDRCKDSYIGAYDPAAAMFRRALSLLGENDYYSYDFEYILNETGWQYQSLLPEGEWDGYVTIIGDCFETLLRRQFVLSDADIVALRDYLNNIAWGDYGYDAEAETYTIFVGGGLGGSLAPRAYGGYVRNADGTFNVYYPTVIYGEYLSAHLENADQYVEALGWPSELEYNGMTFVPTPSEYGYIRVLGYGNTGRMIHAELDGDLVRIISCTEDAAIPAAYDDVTAEALGHDFGDWTVVRFATTEAEGEEQRVCGNDSTHVETLSKPRLSIRPDQAGASLTDGEHEYAIIASEQLPMTGEETESVTAALTASQAEGYTVVASFELLQKNLTTSEMTEGDLSSTVVVDLNVFFDNLELTRTDVQYVLMHLSSDSYGANCPEGVHEHPVAADGTVRMDGLSPVWLMAKPVSAVVPAPAPVPAPAAPSAPVSPKTADSAPIVLWSALLVGSAGGLLLLLRKRREVE